MLMRNQGFIHPATLVPEELEYNKGYEARMSKLNEKFRDMDKVKSQEIARPKEQTKDEKTSHY
jgi:hypothetical protein